MAIQVVKVPMVLAGLPLFVGNGGTLYFGGTKFSLESGLVSGKFSDGTAYSFKYATSGSFTIARFSRRRHAGIRAASRSSSATSMGNQTPRSGHSASRPSPPCAAAANQQRDLHRDSLARMAQAKTFPGFDGSIGGSGYTVR